MNLHVVLEQYNRLSDQFERQNKDLKQGLFAGLDSIVLSLVVNYPLVIFYLQQSHIGINVNY